MKMLVLLIAIFSFGALASHVNAQETSQEETPHLQFVTEYIRELEAIEHIRAAWQEDSKDAGQQWNACIKSSASFQLELQSEIAILRGMHLNSPFEFLIGSITTFYKQKSAIYEDYGDICSAFAVGPKHGVDYQAMAVDMPKMRASLEFIDKALFEASGVVAATLIDLKPDSHDHASHLIITKAERLRLTDNIDASFGDKLKQKNQNFTVSSASVIRDILLDHKCSDDPW